MARTALLCFFLVCGILFFSGCSILEYLDGSPKEEMEEFKQEKGTPLGNKEKSNVETLHLTQEIDILRKENKKIRDENLFEMEKVKDQNELLRGEAEELKAANQRLSDENRAFVEKISVL